jgi:hypothetical protein
LAEIERRPGGFQLPGRDIVLLVVRDSAAAPSAAPSGRTSHQPIDWKNSIRRIARIPLIRITPLNTAAANSESRSALTSAARRSS